MYSNIYDRSVPQRHTRQTDRQTDRQHTTALTAPMLLHGAGNKINDFVTVGALT